MAVRVAINGFGRIGRLVLRAAYESGRKDIEFVAINDLGSVDANAHLLRYDSNHGPFPGTVSTTKTSINLGAKSTIGKNIKVFAERNPADLPWAKLGVDVVLECTGIFTSKDSVQPHLAAGVKKVLISAPATGADLTIVQGVNDRKLRKSHKVVSNASCTTNCLAPVAAVLDKVVGIKHGFMTTVHAYTGDQPVLDTLHKDLHRARAAANSIIPTSTGAARAVGLVLPELAGKLDGTAVRVPTPNVSMVDLVIEAKTATTAEAVNAAMVKAASSGPLKGILAVNDAPLVSVDFNHNPASSVFDLTQTQVTDGRLVRVLSWYDNEWGFSNRMSDTAVQMGKLG
jgi:glyceraldehyde 3-phosphate dehydrogenase